MLYGHADGRAMCPDEESGTEMGFAQLTDVVPSALGVDLMALELCNMGGVEIAYQWRPDNGGFSTQHLVAIPNAGPPLDWDRVFRRLRTGSADAASIDPATLTPASFGELIVAEGGNGRRAHAERNPRAAARLGFEAVACYDLARATAVKESVDALAVALAARDTQAACADVRGPGPDGFTMNYGRDRLERAPFVDLNDLATRLAACAALDEKARAAAAAVATATDSFVCASWGGAALPRFEPGRSGVYITFPPGDTVRRPGETLWSACRWYTPLPVPGVYGRLAWCRDGATPDDGKVQNWFELLDAWFDGADVGGGSNGYGY
jgi:clostripain